MLTTEDLIGLVATVESQSLERKASCPPSRDLRATLCAFANSTPKNQHSVLIIGVENDGTIKGVDAKETDSIQKTVIAAGRDECYPPIGVVPQVVRVGEKLVIAAIVGHSKDAPHFTGHAYTRVGSTSRKSNREEYDRFVLRRIDKVERLLSEGENGKTVKVTWAKPHGAIRPFDPREFDMRFYRVVACDAFVLQLADSVSSATLAVPVDRVMINYSPEHHVTLLEVGIEYPGPPPQWKPIADRIKTYPNRPDFG